MCVSVSAYVVAEGVAIVAHAIQNRFFFFSVSGLLLRWRKRRKGGVRTAVAYAGVSGVRTA